MKKIFIVLISILKFDNSYSQEYYSAIDSTIASFALADGDWIIALNIEQSGIVPQFDSLGNSISSTDPNGSFIFTKLNNRYNLQRLDWIYVNEQSVLKMGKPISISDKVIQLYTTDSILKAEKEWIYPYIYKNDSLNVYDIQYRGSHSPSFRIIFRTKQTMFLKRFDDVDIFASLKIFSSENLNYPRNAQIFTYRSFMKLLEVIEKKLGVTVLY